jgi:hypothetical protein
MKKLIYLVFFLSILNSCVTPTYERSGSFENGMKWEQESDNEEFMRELYFDFGSTGRIDIITGAPTAYNFGLFYSNPKFDISLNREFYTPNMSPIFSLRLDESDRWSLRANFNIDFNYILFEKRIKRTAKICVHCPMASQTDNFGNTRSYFTGPQYAIHKAYEPLARVGLKGGYFTEQYSIELSQISREQPIMAAGGEIIFSRSHRTDMPQNERAQLFVNIRSHILSFGIDYSVKKYLRFNSSNRKKTFGKSRFFNAYANVLFAPSFATSNVQIDTSYNVWALDGQFVETVPAGTYDVTHSNANSLRFGHFGLNLGLLWRLQSASTDKWLRNFGGTFRLETGILPNINELYTDVTETPFDRAYFKFVLNANLNFNTKNKALTKPFIE